MFRWIKNLWSGSEPGAFVSAYGLAESVARLEAATTSWSLFRVAEQAAVGRVSETRVSLRRVVPMFGNAFKPVFTGRFGQVNGHVVLTGRFGLSWFVKLFMSYWLGFCVLFVLLSLLAAAQKPAAAWMSLAGIGMFALGLGMTRLFAWFSRGDAPWLAQVIRTALHAPLSPEAALALPASTSSDARPRFILIVTGVFCLFGLVSTVGALLGMGVGSIYAGGGLIERYPQDVRLGAVVNGLMLLACAYGIYRRYLCADLHGWMKFVS